MWVFNKGAGGGLETFAKVADGKATKIIIPSELQSMASLVTSVKELISDKPAEDAPEK